MLTDENVDMQDNRLPGKTGMPHAEGNPTQVEMKTHSAQNAGDCHGGRAQGCQGEGEELPTGLHRPLGALSHGSRWTGSSRNVVSVVALTRGHYHLCDGRLLLRTERGHEPVRLLHLHLRKSAASHTGR